jgi:hypothetical protein
MKYRFLTPCLQYYNQHYFTDLVVRWMEHRQATAVHHTRIRTKVIILRRSGGVPAGESAVWTQITATDYGFQYFSAQQCRKYLEIFRTPGAQNEIID